MQNEQFTVQNVKCGGCVSTIENGLSELDGVSEVSVTIDGGLVTITGESLDRAQLAEKLASLGYPEA
ncbi:MAG: heavy-metal-associated domain-containing protein [Pseudomonadota bacterium]